MKKFLSLLLVILTIFSCTCTAFAAAIPENEITPLWNNIGNADLSLDFNSNTSKGCVGTYVLGSSNTDSISTKVVVYKKNLLSWTKVVDFGSRTTYEDYQARTLYFNAEEGKTYKVEFTYTVTVNGVSETDTSTVKGTF